MQTAHTNEKGLSAANAQTPMQTELEFSDSGHLAQPFKQNSERPTYLTPRHRRLLLALLDGQKNREEVDAITGASNGPDEVLQARRRHGLVIPCVRKDARDMDGHRVEFGIYSLTDADRAKAAELVRDAAPQGWAAALRSEE